MMKLLLNAIILSALSTVALAQSVVIGYPPPNATVPRGQAFTVEIDRPDSLTGSKEVALVIGVASCPSSGCIPPSDLLGYIAYNGSYDPEFRVVGKPPHQNFSITIPPSFAKGSAQLNVVHLSLVGAGPFPLFQTLSEPITVC